MDGDECEGPWTEQSDNTDQHSVGTQLLPSGQPYFSVLKRHFTALICFRLIKIIKWSAVWMGMSVKGRGQSNQTILTNTAVEHNSCQVVSPTSLS